MRASVRIHLLSASGHLCSEWSAAFTVAPDSAQSVYALAIPLTEIPTDVFFLDIALTDGDDRIVSRSRYCHTRAANLAPLLALPETTLRVQREDHIVTIANTGDHAALFVWLEDSRAIGASGCVYFSDNHFCLFPGETREIELEWHGIEPAERNITVRGWNTNEWKG